MGRGRYSARIEAAENRVGRNPGGEASRRDAAAEQARDEAQYGDLIRTYGDGTRTYERQETAASGGLNDDQRNWVQAMSNVVSSDIRRQLGSEGISSSNIDIDLENGRVTAWVNVSREASPSGLARAYYDLDYTFGVRTSVRPNGTIRRSYTYKSVRLVPRGASAY